MKFIIIDDHSIMRDGLTALLQQTSTTVQVFSARNADEALKLLDQSNDFDLVILDLFIPGTDGFQAISAFGRSHPELPVIVLSSSEDPRDARKALANGALGYVPKSAGQLVLLSAIKLVMNGDLYIPPFILDEKSRSTENTTRTEPQPKLTPRQIEVLLLLCEGHSNKAIATKLRLSEKTVKVHVSLIFRTLNVANRVQASKVAKEAGFI
jgi:two-component system, NarL family, nitrate/nitrite response regulator NarL